MIVEDAKVVRAAAPKMVARGRLCFALGETAQNNSMSGRDFDRHQNPGVVVSSGFEALWQLNWHWNSGLSAKKPLGSMTEPGQLSTRLPALLGWPRPRTWPSS